MAETTSQAAVPTEPEAAQSLLGPRGSPGLGENEASAANLSQAASGLRFVPRADSLCRMQLLAARFGPFRS